jgi:protein ImuB
VVLFREDHRGRWVVACSSSAAGLGIVPDMPLAEATALGGQQAVHVEEFDPAADQAVLERLAEWCAQFSPLVGLEETDAPPECLLLEIDGTAPLWGGEESLAQEIVDEFREHGWRVRVAVADTIGAAWAVARYGPRQGAPQHVPPGKMFAALAPLPIEALRLPPETVDLLINLGVQTVVQLAALPRAGLAVRFGPMVGRRLDQALGAAVESIVGYSPPPEFEAEQVFEYPTEQRATLDHVLAQLIEQLTRRLTAHGRGAMQLECQIDCQGTQGKQKIRLPVGIFQPLATARHLLELLGLQLERRVFPGPVTAVRLAVSRTAPLSTRQQELFTDPRERDGPRQLGRLVDRLSSRLGREAVLRPLLVPDAQPECACRYEPLTGKPSRSPGHQRAAQKKPVVVGRAWRRSLRLEPQPIPLTVQSVTIAGLPAQLRWRRHDEHVARTWGPERIYTGWWRGRTVRRDYYRVETTTGHRLWLFRRLEDGKWFLHGRFE